MKLTIFGLALIWTTNAFAQGLAGEVELDGRPVELFDNGTWRYADGENQSCVTLTEKLSFCGADIWETARPSNPDVMAAYRHDDRHYAQIIYEDLGRQDGLSEESVREFAVQAAQSASSTPVEISESALTEVDGHKAETLVYNANVSGLEIVFVNTYVLKDTSLLQLQTWQVGPLPYSERHRELHADFIEAFKVGSE